MSLSIAEQERILETVQESLTAFIYNELSGIPEIRERLQAHGLKLCIGVETVVENEAATTQPEDNSESSNVDDGVNELHKMGISLADLQEVAQGDIRRSEGAIRRLMEQIREVSSSLSSRGRNYTWGWLHLHYPEMGLGKNPTTLKDPRFAKLSDPDYWQQIVEKALGAASTRTDRKDVLIRLLSTINFANANT